MLALGLAAALAAPVLGQNGNLGSIHVAWHRCAGTPGAERNLQFDRRDPARKDTLVVSWRPGGAGWEKFLASDCQMYFHDSEGDSIAPFWQLGHKGRNKRGLLVFVDPSADSARCPNLWQASTEGGAQYDSFHNFGKLRFAFYVAASQAFDIEGQRTYQAARLIFDHSQVDSLPGADRPMVIELAWWKAYYGLEFHKAYTEGDRYVTINDPTGEHLRRFLARRHGERPRPWPWATAKEGR